MRTARWVLAAAAFGAAAVFVYALPPPAIRTATDGLDDLAARTVPGAYHIHTTRSDGAGDREAVARAAAHAGLKFAILTDHGDGTRPPDPPSYVDNVLLIDAVEISTDQGHYVALDMPRAPYPLAGAAQAVAEDVRRLGGFGVAAHPDSPKRPLRWRDAAVPIDGFEWLNIDSEWRKDTTGRLARAAIGYLLRPQGALADLIDRPSSLDRWNALIRTRPVVALAADDAHGGVRTRSQAESGLAAGSLGIPSYDASFRTVSIDVLLDRPLTGDAAADARVVLAAIRAGRVFSAITGAAGPPLLDFHVELGLGHLEMGGVAEPDADGTLVVRAAMPAWGQLVLLHDGREEMRTASGSLRRLLTGANGVYRVEIRQPTSAGERPWVVSNPIYFIHPTLPAVPAPAPAVEGAIAPFPWAIEKDPSSSAILRTAAHTAELDYTLGAAASASPFVALASDVNRPISSIRLGLKGDRPMRVSVQVRDREGRRWGRSYYVDPAGTEVTAPLSDLRLIGDPDVDLPLNPAALTSVLIAIDLTNAAPGHHGRLTVLSSGLY